MADYIIVSYYTAETYYEESAKTLLNSLKKFNIPHDIQSVPNLGSWQKNTCYKPVFLKKMMGKHYPKSIIWVDCDAEFVKYPKLFEELECNIAAHLFKIEKGIKQPDGTYGTQLASGTVFLKNIPKTYQILLDWEKECRDNPNVLDQKSLENVLKGYFYNLPGEYCKIFDRMAYITDPVIIHWQHSRIAHKFKTLKLQEAEILIEKQKNRIIT